MTLWQSYKTKRARRRLEYDLFSNGNGSFNLWYKVMQENNKAGVWDRGRLEGTFSSD